MDGARRRENDVGDRERQEGAEEEDRNSHTRFRRAAGY